MLRLSYSQLPRASLDYMRLQTLSMLQLVLKSKMGRNERPPRIGVNLIGVCAQVFPVQFFQLRS